MFKSKKQKAADKAAKKAAAIAKNAAAKKAKINKVERPEPAKPAAKPAVNGPVDANLNPAKNIPGHGKPKAADPKVNIHMLGNAMVDGVQYKADSDIQVPASVARAIGKSAVSMNTWKVTKKNAGLGSLHK